MANKAATLVRLCKTPNGWKRYPAAFHKNGNLKQDVVIVDGQECKYPVGRYQVRTYKGRKTNYEDVGDRLPLDVIAETLRLRRPRAETVVDEAGITLRLPRSLIARAEAMAKKEGVTLDTWVSIALDHAVDATR